MNELRLALAWVVWLSLGGQRVWSLPSLALAQARTWSKSHSRPKTYSPAQARSASLANPGRFICVVRLTQRGPRRTGRPRPLPTGRTSCPTRSGWKRRNRPRCQTRSSSSAQTRADSLRFRQAPLSSNRSAERRPIVDRLTSPLFHVALDSVKHLIQLQRTQRDSIVVLDESQLDDWLAAVVDLDP